MQTQGMTTTDLTPRPRRHSAPRERHRGDVTRMADKTLNEERRKATGTPNQMAKRGTGKTKHELTFSLIGSKKNALNQIEAAIIRDLPDSDENEDGPDPTLLEIMLRTAEIRAGWTEQERQSRLAYRTRRVELQFITFLRLTGQG